MITKLGHRFQTMKLKGTAVKIGVPATEAEITDGLAYIDSSLESDKLTQAHFKVHCNSFGKSTVILRNMYINSRSVWISHVTTAQDIQSGSLQTYRDIYLPRIKEHFKKFDELYGQSPDGTDPPSFVPTPTEDARQRPQIDHCPGESQRCRSL